MGIKGNVGLYARLHYTTYCTLHGFVYTCTYLCNFSWWLEPGVTIFQGVSWCLGNALAKFPTIGAEKRKGGNFAVQNL